jgi:predicted Fe-Mo cluster-binding NifX family protein
MKIAIPTNDGLTISADCNQANGFLVITIQLGEIVKEEIRENKTGEIPISVSGQLSMISDCKSVIVHETDTAFASLLERNNKEVVLTRELFITNAYVHYLENNLRKEANTCCCP